MNAGRALSREALAARRARMKAKAERQQELRRRAVLQARRNLCRPIEAAGIGRRAVALIASFEGIA